jgi:parallel beta-helix repeat protein
MVARARHESSLVVSIACTIVVSGVLAACSSSHGAAPVPPSDRAPAITTVTDAVPGTAAAVATAATTVGVVTGPAATTGAGLLDPLVCEHTGPGADYTVGPGQTYSSIGDVPWAKLTAGDSVRIFWRNEPYREKFLIRGHGTQDAPIVVCGVAGPDGQRPVIDGENATASPDMGYATIAGQARGLIHVSLGKDDVWGTKPEFIVIQGLHVRNALYRYRYTGSDGATVPYAENAAGIFIERGEHVTVRGVELESDGNGLFVASGDSEETRSRDIVLERSYVHGNGTPDVGPDRRHNIYTEADGMVFQYNEIGPLAPGAMGAALKDRSTGTVVRYNLISGGARSMDLVDAEDSSPLVRNDPRYRTTLVYGNVIVNDAGTHGADLSNMIHYGGDSGVTDGYRKGVLYFVHNTVIVRADQDSAAGVGRYQTSLFDLDTNDEAAVITNNVFYVRSVTPGAAATELDWGRSAGKIQLGVNWASPAIANWRYPSDTIGTVSGAGNLLTNTDNNPAFVDEPGGDVSPAKGSPLVDAAEAPSAELEALGLTVTEEYAGDSSARARPDDGASDLGALESDGASGAGAPSPTVANGGASSTTAMSSDTVSAPTTAAAPTGAFALPEGAEALAGKGPQGADNGLASPCGEGVLCVGGSGSYRSIGAAIADAKAGDVIEVSGGTYVENVALGTYTALDTRNVTLLGGFSADFSSRDAARNRTLIDGGGGNPAVQLHVVSSGTTVLDGFTLTDGVGLGTDYSDGGGDGGGVYAQQQGSGTLVISHNEVYGNRTRAFDDASRGGGIHADAIDWDGGTPTVRIEDNNVHDNQAGRGAGIEVRGHAAVIANNLIERNLGHSDHGGGIYLSAARNLLTDNIVSGNKIGVTAGYGWGGGILVGGVPATLTGNVITDNYAPSIGSGIFWDEGAIGTMTGDLLVANRCPTDGRSGAAMYIDGGDPGPSRVSATRLTIVGHTCPDLPDGGAIVLEGGSSISITASILWANGTDVVAVAGEKFTIEGSTTSTGQDPQFVDPTHGDYSLNGTSPAAGQGAVG